MDLTKKQKRSLAHEGYVVVPNVVDEGLIAAARQEVDSLLEKNPAPENHQGFHFHWCNDVTTSHPLLNCLTQSMALNIVNLAIAPRKVQVPDQVQVSFNFPPWDHRPGGPHLDGLTPPEASGRPGTFTLLAGIFLTDQKVADMGNLWVWPGTHSANADFFDRQGSDALLANAPYPPTALPKNPRQVVGGAGDLLLAHYLLGHNMGGNLSSSVRKVLYFRLRSETHRKDWRACVTDPLYEFAPIRAALETR